jgi:hypothetical protein
MVYTYEELKKIVDDDWNSLSDEARLRWYNNPSPTFEMYVLGLIKEGDTVRIDHAEHTYEKIN